jgi:SMC interacting uncharacterized protein involved in chromosome segregation
VEEQSLLILREQLTAVQQIRRELEKKDAQLQALKLQVVELQSFREQSINLRTQCRLVEERSALMVSLGSPNSCRQIPAQTQSAHLHTRRRPQETSLRRP